MLFQFDVRSCTSLLVCVVAGCAIAALLPPLTKSAEFTMLSEAQATSPDKAGTTPPDFEKKDEDLVKKEEDLVDRLHPLPQPPPTPNQGSGKDTNETLITYEYDRELKQNRKTFFRTVFKSPDPERLVSSNTKCIGGGLKSDGSCMTLFDYISEDLLGWQGHSNMRVQLKQVLKTHPKAKLGFIQWDGKDVQVLIHTRFSIQMLNKREVSSTMLVGRLILDLVKHARLPPIGFFFLPTDKCSHDLPVPQFCLAKAPYNPNILLPNVVRPMRPRKLNGYYTWGHDFLDAVAWSDKTADAYWRGSMAGVKQDALKSFVWNMQQGRLAYDVEFEPKLDTLCMGRNGRKAPACPINLGVVCKPNVTKDPLKYLCNTCGATRNTFEEGRRHKFLPQFLGWGYTGRLKDCASWGSLVIKQYRYFMNEHFERGMVHGVDGHVLDLTAGSHTDFLNVLDWAYAHDHVSKQIAERGSAYVRWALSDETVLCYVWRLLKQYNSMLHRNGVPMGGSQDLRGFVNGKGCDLIAALSEQWNASAIKGCGGRFSWSLFTAPAARLASNEEHENFVRKCDSIADQDKSSKSTT